jgi:hypothetical protein
MQEHQLAGVIDIPGKIAPAIRNGGEERILQRTAFHRGIDAGLGNRADEVRGKKESRSHHGNTFHHRPCIAAGTVMRAP